MTEIADFSQSEVWTVRTTRPGRCGAAPELQFADADVRASATDRELASCPVIVRPADGCNPVLFETGDRRYRCPFFCKPYEHFGSGVREHSDLSERHVALLQAQADQSAEERGDLQKKQR
jgi:hypothetical protein